MTQNFTTATASVNTAVGYQAGHDVTTGTYNTMIGYQTGEKVTDGQYNVGLGDNALPTTTTGDRNICIGRYAGYGLTSANDNVLIGYAVGYAQGQANQLTGGGNVMVGGYNAPANAGDITSIVIGHSLTGKGNYTGMINSSSGGVYQGNNSSSWSTTSDRRLKKNIVDCNIGLEEINKIQVREFEYKTKDDLSEIESDGLKESDIIDKSGVHVGAIAQEIQTILPKCVKEESTGVLSVDSDNLTWHLVKAVQELTERVKQLEDG